MRWSRLVCNRGLAPGARRKPATAAAPTVALTIVARRRSLPGATIQAANGNGRMTCSTESAAPRFATAAHPCRPRRIQAEGDQREDESQRHVKRCGPQARFRAEWLEQPQGAAHVRPRGRSAQVAQEATSLPCDGEGQEQRHEDRDAKRGRAADRRAKQDFEEPCRPDGAQLMPRCRDEPAEPELDGRDAVVEVVCERRATPDDRGSDRRRTPGSRGTRTRGRRASQRHARPASLGHWRRSRSRASSAAACSERRAQRPPNAARRATSAPRAAQLFAVRGPAAVPLGDRPELTAARPSDRTSPAATARP